MARSSQGGLNFRIRIDDETVVAGLRKQRREIRQDIKELMLAAAKETVLPTTKALAPRIVRRTLTVRATTNGAYLTTTARGMDRRIVGLLNFGGVVRTEILPVKGRALKIGDRYAARVTAPRKYRGRHFFEKSIDANIGRFSRHVERALTRRLQSRVTYARTFG